VDFRSTGGIFLRLDSSGVLNVYNSAGASIATFTGNQFSGSLNKTTTLQSSTPITTTASTTQVYTGQSLKITPNSSGNVMAFFHVLMSNSVAGGGVKLAAVATTSQNAGGVAFISELFNESQTSWVSVTAGAAIVVPRIYVATGLTVGTPYWIQLGFEAVTAGTATCIVLTNPTAFAVEF